ncbi:hypothetical protein LAD12857_33210 [Lacrimispora amygdalina]|uniref:HTH cro/C1-type domain-containing protein n=1 Tax=Lacrimispora amygdalina TaxID=253257 RepID=A0ABQ5M8W6_9FIRM
MENTDIPKFDNSNKKFTEKKKYNKKLGKKLRKEREHQGKTQEEWSECFGVDPRNYRRYENGNTKIPYRILVYLHKTCNVDLNSFICDD